ncbi:MAG: hypothetical protein LBN05_05590 [Oscillospiraceae bacterium]|nr:hypothetical protein [Oscillospiraceae bacterium]
MPKIELESCAKRLQKMSIVRCIARIFVLFVAFLALSRVRRNQKFVIWHKLVVYFSADAAHNTIVRDGQKPPNMHPRPLCPCLR